jgi:glycosyltransferase involved in cell wall biosynthesis
MRIGIDARYICYRRGIGNYVYNLSIELNNLIQYKDLNIDLYLFVNSFKVKNRIRNNFNSNAKIIVIPIPFYPIWEQFLLPIYCLFFKINILHSTSNSAPIFLCNKVKLVQTIHDVMYMLPSSILPKPKSNYQYFGRLYLKLIVPLGVIRANHIITVSIFSKKDIEKYISRISEKKVSVIYEAPGFNLTKINKSLNVSRTLQYFITFGSLDPRKNTFNTILAFKKFIIDNKLDFKLYIVGLKKDEIIVFKKFIIENDIFNNVILTNYLDEEQLIDLYINSTALIYISLYEGFGIPILEGMSCKTLVITSKNACIPEIAGENNVLYVDPLNINDIMEKLNIAFFDNKKRQFLIDNASNHVKNFNWSNVALETLNVYNSINVK